MNEDTKLPLSDVKILAIEESFTIEFNRSAYTDSEGNYTLEEVQPGNYIIFTTEILNESYKHLTKELFKDIAILNGEVFQEGSQLASNILEYAKLVPVSPGEHVSDIDFGLHSYNFTFQKGLNLFGYPGIPVSKYDTSHEIGSLFGSDLHSLRWQNPNTQEWKITKPIPTAPDNMSGDNFTIQTGQGYLIYSYNKVGPLYLPPFIIAPPQKYKLIQGKNFIAYPSTLQSPIRNSYKLLSDFGNEDEVASVHKYDNIAARWSSNTWIWGRPGGSLFSISQGDGYVVNMKKAKVFEP